MGISFGDRVPTSSPIARKAFDLIRRLAGTAGSFSTEPVETQILGVCGRWWEMSHCVQWEEMWHRAGFHITWWMPSLSGQRRRSCEFHRRFCVSVTHVTRGRSFDSQIFVKSRVTLLCERRTEKLCCLPPLHWLNATSNTSLVNWSRRDCWWPRQQNILTIQCRRVNICN